MSDAEDDGQDKLYRLLTGKHTRNEGGEIVTYEAGKRGKDLIRLSDDKARRMGLGLRVQLVGEKAEAGGSAEAANQDAEDDSDSALTDWGVVLNHTVPDVVESLQEIDSVDDLLAIRDQEANNANRKGVLKAIDERVAALAGVDE